MIIKEFFPWLVGISVLLLLGGAAVAEEPPLIAADLDAEIQNLPSRHASDPVLVLKKRLSELNSADSSCSERQALREAVSLIQIVRQTRISSAPPRSAEGILLTDSTGWSVNRPAR
jgi:hypothetical protein